MISFASVCDPRKGTLFPFFKIIAFFRGGQSVENIILSAEQRGHIDQPKSLARLPLHIHGLSEIAYRFFIRCDRDATPMLMDTTMAHCVGLVSRHCPALLQTIGEIPYPQVLFFALLFAHRL